MILISGECEVRGGGVDFFYYPEVFNFVDAFTLRCKGLQ